MELLKDKLTAVFRDTETKKIDRHLFHCNYEDVNVIHSTAYYDEDNEIEALQICSEHYSVTIEKDDYFKLLVKEFNKHDLLKGKVILFDVEKESLGVNDEIECTIMLKKAYIKGYYKTNIKTKNGLVPGTKYFMKSFEDFCLVD